MSGRQGSPLKARMNENISSELKMKDEAKTKEQLIAEVKELRRHLSEIEAEEYRVAFEYARDAMIWVDTERGLIINCNKSAETLLAKTREEIVGHLLLTLHPPEKADYYVRIFKIQVDRKYSFAYEEKYGFAYEGEVITKSRKIIPVYITASVTRAGDKQIIQQSFHEISRYKQIENVLKRTLTFAEGLIDSIPYLIFCKDKDGVYLNCNTAFSEFAGVSKSKIIGKTDIEVFSKEVAEKFHKKDKAVLETLVPESSEESVSYPDGRNTVLDTLRMIYYGPEDNVLGIIGISRDITGDKKKEQNMREAEIANRRHLMEAFKKATKNLMVAQEQLKLKNAKVNETLREVEEANRKIMDSIRYAKVIQTSLLPNLDGANVYLPDSFVLWMPRDVVGGDIFFKDLVSDPQGREGFIMAVIDCTGHGVPGAFMTMIASSGLRRIIKDEGCHDPATILKQLNFVVKTSLQQDKKDTLSDDGLDAAICFISDFKDKGKILTYAGAKIPLFYVENNEVNIIKGDRQSIGYKRSDLGFSFTNHTMKIEEDMSFYLSTDGFIDQLGGVHNRRFGTAQFKNLIKENAHLPFERQRKVFIRAFNEYKGTNERRDDVTVIGFTFRK